METLNDQDLDWLTAAENRLMRLRKREAANTNNFSILHDLSDAIELVDRIRGYLGARLGRETETIPENF